MSKEAGPPKLFDRQRLRQNRSRAGKTAPDGGFLARLGSDRLIERLGDIERTWDRALINGPLGSDALPDCETVACDIAAARLPERAGLKVVCDEEHLPFGRTSFDLVLSNLTLQSVNDLPGSLIQFREILIDDGYLLAVLFGGETLGELRHALISAESERSDRTSPRVAPFAEVRDLGNLLQRSGFALPVADVDRVVVRYPDLFALVHDLRALGENNALAARGDLQLDRRTLALAEDIYRARFPDGDGIRATFDLVFLSGWAPHPDQPKPLAPGSAKHSLAEALKPKD